jgi:hypothetical protein
MCGTFSAAFVKDGASVITALIEPASGLLQLNTWTNPRVNASVRTLTAEVVILVAPPVYVSVNQPHANS